MATKQEFGSLQELLTHADTPVLVDFYAPWCGPCQMMAKILEDVNAAMQQQVKIVKINTDNYPELASQHQVYALPTLVLFQKGQPIDRIEGVMQTHKLIDRLQGALGR